jgi:ATP-binding protein involved in chromosome partitioning
LCRGAKADAPARKKYHCQRHASHDGVEEQRLTSRRERNPILTVEQVRSVLDQVNDPALGRSFAAAGMVGEVTVDGARARIRIRLTTPACPWRERIERSIREAVSKLDPAAEVEVHLSAEVARRAGPQPERLPGVRNVIAVAAGKGGVGKSTVATNLAAALRVQGARVGILDADAFGPSIPQMMGAPEVPPGVAAGQKITPAIHHGISVVSVGFFVERGTPVIWRGPMVHKLLQQFLDDVAWGELDYLVVDLPPGTGDTQLSLSQLIPVTGAVMVTTPQEVSILDVEKALGMWKKVDVPVLGVIENMSYYLCPKCGHEEEIFSRGGGRKLAEREGLRFLGEVPLQPAVRSGGDAGKPVVLADSASPVARVFVDIAQQVACALSVHNLPDPGPAKRSSKLSVLR